MKAAHLTLKNPIMFSFEASPNVLPPSDNGQKEYDLYLVVKSVQAAFGPPRADLYKEG